MTDPVPPCLLLFGSDLRINDNPALNSAIERGGAVVALYVLDDENGRRLGAASRWWLHHSLTALKESLATLNIQLVLKSGPCLGAIQALVEETRAAAVVWNRQYHKEGVHLGKSLKEWAREKGIEAESFNGSLLHEPHTLRTKSGGSFKVFTPFWRACLAETEPRPVSGRPSPAARTLPRPSSETLDGWRLAPKAPDWAAGFSGIWQPGEDGAAKALEVFLEHRLESYSWGRDVPSQKNTSGLSPHLRFGEISPVQIFHATMMAAPEAGHQHARKFLSEIGWRDFSHHLLYHNENLQTENFDPKFDCFAWYGETDHDARLGAWQRGQTGYPIVDAGMRELWQTGWMHNRVRMIAASFLVKHLLIDWRHGEKWFWNTLIDACPANNAAGWQWIAGCGADAAPYFRVFNPVLQGSKFDPDGAYVRRFVPELANLPDAAIHKPWSMSAEKLALYGVALGETYPHPMIDHSFARERALQTFNKIKQKAA